MKTLIILGLLSPSAVLADTIRQYGADGLPQGRIERQGNTERFYGHDGLPQGRAERHGNTIQYYGQDGLPKGRVEIKP